MIKILYTFDGLNRINYYQQQTQTQKGSFNNILTVQERLEKQKEPSNLTKYIKDCHPFDCWNKDGDTYNHTSLNEFKHTQFDTKDNSYLWYWY